MSDKKIIELDGEKYEVINTAGRFGAFSIPKEWPRCERIFMCNSVPKPLRERYAVYNSKDEWCGSFAEREQAVRHLVNGTEVHGCSIIHMREVREEK